MFDTPPSPKGAARYSDHDLEPLRAALLALSKGDFTQQPPTGAETAAAHGSDSVLGQIWRLADAVATELSALNHEVARRPEQVRDIAQVTAAVAEEPRKAKILLVDDRAENLVALEAILSALNQQLVPVRSGEEALKALLAEEFAVILLDVLMPGMDGFETAARIKRRARTHDVPIIFLTAAGAEPGHASRGYAAGAVDYIAKPFDPRVLRAKVAVFVDLYLKNRQLREQAGLLRLAEGATGGLLAELSRQLSAVEATAATLASLPAVKTDGTLADSLTQLDHGISQLRDTLDTFGAGG